MLTGSSDAAFDAATPDARPDSAIPTEASVTPDAHVTPVPEASTSDVADLMCVTSGFDAAAVTETTFDCCRTLLDGLLGGSGFSEFFPDASADNPQVPACCRAIKERLRQEDPPDAAMLSDAAVNDIDSVSRFYSPCCNALDGGVACDPWGPPVPPEMPSRFEDWAEVA
jgi:hypothetical protein